METAHPRPKGVRRRQVFYIPGYDPFHPRRYRELYRKEGTIQAEVSGYTLALRPKTKGKGPYGWHVSSRIGGVVTDADIEVLVWSDIVRGSMSQTIAATYLQMIRTAWIYIASGTLRRLMWLRKGPVIAALYPVGMLIAQLLLSLLAGAVAGNLLTTGAGVVAGLVRWSLGPVAAYLYWPLFMVVAVSVLRWFKGQDGRFFAYYLMHDYAYSAQFKGANLPALEERMKEFGDRIAEALQSDTDEVLVVGHSSGAHLAVSILSDLIRAGRVRADGPALGFLSLGQVVPMVSFLPKADRLRADLAFLSARDEVSWIDVTAPGDGCAFALCDPVAVSGVAPPDQRWPLVISAAFTQTLTPETWKLLRWRFFRLHFQYLCAFDRPGDYDYFQIPAGPYSLGDRYANRLPSKSRIDVPASKYTSMSA